jgi:hypothetical protein
MKRRFPDVHVPARVAEGSRILHDAEFPDAFRSYGIASTGPRISPAIAGKGRLAAHIGSISLGRQVLSKNGWSGL